MFTVFARRAPHNLARFGQSAFKASSPMPKAMAVKQMGGVRHAGAGAIGAGMAMTGVGGACVGLGNVFAGMVVGTARNPGMQQQLLVYTMMGAALVEFMGFLALGIGGASFASD